MPSPMSWLSSIEAGSGMSEPPFWHPLLTVWVDRVDAEWRRSRVGDAQREAMRRDLVADLAQARLAGASLGALTGVDPHSSLGTWLMRTRWTGRESRFRCGGRVRLRWARRGSAWWWQPCPGR